MDLALVTDIKESKGMLFVFPPALKPNDWIAVVAPSSPFDRDEFLQGLAWLRGRYRVLVSSSILARSGYLAGDDARRTIELSRAMLDPDVKAICAVRGWYGAMRIVDDLPWDAFFERPKWIVGFSDITALHVIANAKGIASIHAAHVTGIARESPMGRLQWLRALESPTALRTWSGLRLMNRAPTKEAFGPVVGGNVALLEAMAAAGKLSFPKGAILVLEDVTERPYRMDRMLTSLRLGGYFSELSAIVCGDFVRCDPGPDGVTIEEILESFANQVGVPVLVGAPFGHGERCEPIILGSIGRIESGRIHMDNHTR